MKLDKALQDSGIQVDTATHNDLLAIMTCQNSAVGKTESDISFQHDKKHMLLSLITDKGIHMTGAVHIM